MVAEDLPPTASGIPPTPATRQDQQKSPENQKSVTSLAEETQADWQESAEKLVQSGQIAEQ